MGYRDELAALRVRNEALSADLVTARSDLEGSRERVERLETELAEQEGRVAELEIALGGEQGEEARRRTAAKRRIVAGALAMLVGLGVLVGFRYQAETERERREAMERRAETQRVEAELAATRAQNARLDEMNARLRMEIESLATRRVRGRLPPPPQ